MGDRRLKEKFPPFLFKKYLSNEPDPSRWTVPLNKDVEGNFMDSEIKWRIAEWTTFFPSPTDPFYPRQS
jgi:hypothetical protein